jgi:putative tricarboxylic transport membrane protein
MGVALGTLVGVLPGLGPVATIALLLPITFSLPPAGALIMLAGIYYGAQYGSSTTAILLRVPGEASGVVTAQEGHLLARPGRAGPALGIAALASLVGGVMAALVLALLLVPLAALRGRLRTCRDGRPDAARSRRGGRALADADARGLGAGGARRAARPGRHGCRRRAAALHLRHPRTGRRHRLRAARHGTVRHRRTDPRARSGRFAAPRRCRSARPGRVGGHCASVAPAMRGGAIGSAVGLLPGASTLLAPWPPRRPSADCSAAAAAGGRARWRASPRRSRRTTPPRKPPSRRCLLSACRPMR